MEDAVEHGEYVEAIARNGEAIRAAVLAAGIDAPVPSCPGWSLFDLVRHQGMLFQWVTEIVEHRPADPTAHWSRLEAPELDDWQAWWDAAVEEFVAALGAAAPDDDVWSWTPDRSVRFWSRRQAHESSVHRWDAENAAGTPTPLDRRLAVDGITEFFDLLPSRPGYDDLRGTGQTLHLHCTDGEGEWMVRRAPDGLVVTQEHGKGDVAARGGASDLLLFLWGRAGLDALEVFGDKALLEDWQERARF